MNQEIELTLEQDFSLRSFSDLVQKMSHKQAQEFLIEQHKLMMIRDSLYQDFLRQEWKSKLDSALL
jgi:hypothetical protein